VWLAAVVSSQARLGRARRRGIAHELDLRRRLHGALAVEHAALAAALLTGFALMALHGWRPGYPRWLSIKLGLVAFLLLPLEGMHAWVNHVWIARALPSQPPPPAPLSRELDRWIGMDDMVRTLAALLLGLALPLIVWLSVARPV
jgi:hypothetical protein